MIRGHKRVVVCNGKKKHISRKGADFSAFGWHFEAKGLVYPQLGLRSATGNFRVLSFAQEYVVFSLVGLKGDLSLLEIC